MTEPTIVKMSDAELAKQAVLAVYPNAQEAICIWDGVPYASETHLGCNWEDAAAKLPKPVEAPKEECPGCKWVNKSHLRDCPVRKRLKEIYAERAGLLPPQPSVDSVPAQAEKERTSQWIDCKQELPQKNNNHCWLAWITSQNKAGGYIDLVSYGDYVCQNEDIRPGDEGYCEDNDDGNFKQSGWYREEETHGGEYDWIFVNLNGKVTFWMPLPTPPEAVDEAN